MGHIYDFFGYPATDRSATAVGGAQTAECPFLGDVCTKTLKDNVISGACAIKPVKSGPVICCPIRLYADDYRILRDVAVRAFGEDLELYPGPEAKRMANRTGMKTIGVFGKRWGGELRLPQRNGSGNYYVDWILALINSVGELEEFVAIEVQTIDTTGNYRASREALLDSDRTVVESTVGLNWENVSKRIIPQLIYKGQVLQREDLCRKGLFFICPTPVYSKIANRLGGEGSLVEYGFQPASITFMAYDYSDSAASIDGMSLGLDLEVERTTTVYKLQEAFNNVNLPDRNVYAASIRGALE